MEAEKGYLEDLKGNNVTDNQKHTLYSLALFGLCILGGYSG